MEALESLINNLINGNISTAKKQAKEFAEWEIRNALIEAGYSTQKATLAAAWLNGCDCYQAYCDAD